MGTLISAGDFRTTNPIEIRSQRSQKKKAALGARDWHQLTASDCGIVLQADRNLVCFSDACCVGNRHAAGEANLPADHQVQERPVLAERLRPSISGVLSRRIWDSASAAGLSSGKIVDSYCVFDDGVVARGVFCA